jgi:hypothetical protein
LGIEFGDHWPNSANEFHTKVLFWFRGNLNRKGF